MIGLGARLSLGGGHEAFARLTAIAGGVTIGVALMLLTISSLRAVRSYTARPCWECATILTQPPHIDTTKTNVLLVHNDQEVFGGTTIARYDIAAKGAGAPLIPGLARQPQTGEYYVSPALAELMARTPDNQLDNRFPGTRIGIIGRAGLHAPNALVAIVGHAPSELETGQMTVSSITTSLRTAKDRPIDLSVQVLFVLIATGLLASVLTLIATATRLSAARREQKFAALRLAGATPRQIIQFAAIDAAIGSSAGAVLGFGLFYVLRPLMAKALSGILPMFPDELALGPSWTLIVLLGTPLLAAGAAILSLRRVQISPLGVAQKITPKPPRLWRIIPLVTGLATMIIIWYECHGLTSSAKSPLVKPFGIGFALTILGLAIAGPWLTMASARLWSRITRSASMLLAVRRLADNPKAAFRPVSVLAIAAFLCTMFATLLPNFGVDPSLPTNFKNPNLLNIIVDVGGMPPAQLATRTAQLQAVPGIHLTRLYKAPDNPHGAPMVLIRCADFARLERTTHCPSGATATEVVQWYGASNILDSTKPPTTVPPGQLQQVVGFIAVSQHGQPTIDRVRTILRQEGVNTPNLTPAESADRNNRLARQINYAIDGIFVIILLIAACSLAVATAGGLVERKRPFGLLRVNGVSFAQLSSVVLMESAIPLLSATIVASGIGFATGALMIRSFISSPEHDVAVRALPTEYYLMMGIGVGTALVVLLVTLPLLAAITKPEQVRFE